MSDRIDIEFPGEDGTTLRGWLYLPAGAGAGPRPAITLAHGFAAEETWPSFRQCLRRGALCRRIWRPRFGSLQPIVPELAIAIIEKQGD